MADIYESKYSYKTTTVKYCFPARDAMAAV